MTSILRKIGTGLGLFLSALFAMAVAASATPTPSEQVGTQLTDAKDDVASFVTTYGIPALFALLVLGVIIGVGVKYVRRGARTT